MTKEEFLRIEYQTLREEIRESKSRAFQIVSVSVVGVPAGHFIAQTYRIDALDLLLPLIVIVFGLLYLSENHAIMRCGRYIKQNIETQISGIVGWEHWLSGPGEFEKRSVDRYLTYCFYLIFFVYFVGSVFLSARFASIQYGNSGAAILIGLYIVLGMLFGAFLWSKILVTTTTKSEPQPKARTANTSR